MLGREADKLKILEQIEDRCRVLNCFSEDELGILSDFSQDENLNIRSAVARVLVNSTEEQSEELLLHLTTDKASLVRTEACDSLGSCGSKRAYHVLKNIIKRDRSGMVRGYAVSSFAQISIKLSQVQDARSFLKECLSIEQVVFTKIQIYAALYQMGEESYIKELLELIHTPRYQNRCAVVHALAEIMNENNRNLIRNALVGRKKIEKSKAVISTIESVMHECGEDPNDWRLRGQEEYLHNAKLHLIKFKASIAGDYHTHCEFCWHKFMENSDGVEDCSDEGYCTVDGVYWICKNCFVDFKEKFKWKLI